MTTTTTPATAALHAQLRSTVAIAARAISTPWPLQTFIAQNPLAGLEHESFSRAVALAGDRFGARGTLDESEFRAAHAAGRITDVDLLASLSMLHPEAMAMPASTLGNSEFTAGELLIADLQYGEQVARPARTRITPAERVAPDIALVIDDLTAKWVGAFLGASETSWAMPGRENGFYTAWRDLAALDRTLPSKVRATLSALPECPEDAILSALATAGVDPADALGLAEAHLTRLPGWAGHVRWAAERTAGIDLTSYLAMRLSYETLLLAAHGLPQLANHDLRAGTQSIAPPSARDRVERIIAILGIPSAAEGQIVSATRVLNTMQPVDRAFVWLGAFEYHYRATLLAEIAAAPATIEATGASDGHPRPSAQLVFCIDPRSEGIRRHLEARGSWETFGFAGFFAAVIRFRSLVSGSSIDSCPVLVSPRNTVDEVPLRGAHSAAARQLASAKQANAFRGAFSAAKHDLLAPFSLAEASGWIAGPFAAAKTLASAPFATLRTRMRNAVAPTAPSTLTVDDGFTLEERVLFTHAMLTLIGLTTNFARVVVLSGHGSSTVNNPFASSLDCGACGGNPGGPNARVAAIALADPAVREALAHRGIVIPDDTVFLAAEHDTVTDQVAILDSHSTPDTHTADVAALTAALSAAGHALSQERAASLPGAGTSVRKVRERATHWAEVFPEWGLAGNAAMVIGPRAMTAHIDLERRVFLHSYDASIDADGTALETIMTAPLVVAQWINAQYYFSSVDRRVFGSGSKTIHNVHGGLGVISGHSGDLRIGLPEQSVAVGDRLIHEPMRLSAIIEAPLDRIGQIISRNTMLRDLFDNGWISLTARPTPKSPWYRYDTYGWKELPSS